MSTERLDRLQDLHATVGARLKAVGQRYTSNRRALVEVLGEERRPVAINDILGRDRSLPLSSAYRGLAVLEQAGVVHRIHTTDEFARFELVEDLSEHHHHLVCAGCGSVEDFHAPPGFERTVARAIDEAARSQGFRASGHRLDLTGLCRDCAPAAPAPRTATRGTAR